MISGWADSWLCAADFKVFFLVQSS